MTSQMLLHIQISLIISNFTLISYYLILILIILKCQGSQCSGSSSLHLCISKIEQLNQWWNSTFYPVNPNSISHEHIPGANNNIKVPTLD